jgi:chromosome segregation ATPase
MSKFINPGVDLETTYDEVTSPVTSPIEEMSKFINTGVDLETTYDEVISLVTSPLEEMSKFIKTAVDLETTYDEVTSPVTRPIEEKSKFINTGLDLETTYDEVTSPVTSPSGGDLDQLSSTMWDNDANIAYLENECKNWKNKCDDLDQQIITWERKYEDVTKLEKSSAEFEEMTSKLKNYELDLGNIQQDLAKSLVEIEQMTVKLKNYEAEFPILEEECQNWKIKSEELECEIEMWHKKCEDVTKFENSTLEVEEMMAKFTISEKNLQNTQQDQFNSSQTFEEMRIRLCKYEADFSRLQEECENWKSKCEEREPEIENKHDGVSKLENNPEEVIEMTTKLKKYEEELEATKEKLLNSSVEVEKLTTELHNKEAVFPSLVEECENWKQKCVNLENEIVTWERKYEEVTIKDVPPKKVDWAKKYAEISEELEQVKIDRFEWTNKAQEFEDSYNDLAADFDSKLSSERSNWENDMSRRESELQDKYNEVLQKMQLKEMQWRLRLDREVGICKEQLLKSEEEVKQLRKAAEQQEQDPLKLRRL